MVDLELIAASIRVDSRTAISDGVAIDSLRNRQECPTATRALCRAMSLESKEAVLMRRPSVLWPVLARERHPVRPIGPADHARLIARRHARDTRHLRRRRGGRQRSTAPRWRSRAVHASLPWRRLGSARIVAQSLRSGERKVLVEGGQDAHYLSTGHVVYAVGGVLFAMTFDAARLAPADAAVPVVDGILRPRGNSGDTVGPTAQFSVSDTGTLHNVLRAAVSPHRRPVPDVSDERWPSPRVVPRRAGSCGGKRALVSSLPLR